MVCSRRRENAVLPGVFANLNRSMSQEIHGRPMVVSG